MRIPSLPLKTRLGLFLQDVSYRLLRRRRNRELFDDLFRDPAAWTMFDGCTEASLSRYGGMRVSVNREPSATDIVLSPHTVAMIVKFYLEHPETHRFWPEYLELPPALRRKPAA